MCQSFETETWTTFSACVYIILHLSYCILYSLSTVSPTSDYDCSFLRLHWWMCFISRDIACIFTLAIFHYCKNNNTRFLVFLQPWIIHVFLNWYCSPCSICFCLVSGSLVRFIVGLIADYDVDFASEVLFVGLDNVPFIAHAEFCCTIHIHFSMFNAISSLIVSCSYTWHIYICVCVYI